MKLLIIIAALFCWLLIEVSMNETDAMTICLQHHSATTCNNAIYP